MKIFICMLFLFFSEMEHNLSPTSVNWKSGMFSGTIKMTKGTLSFNNDILVDGSMVFDANTIDASDLEPFCLFFKYHTITEYIPRFYNITHTRCEYLEIK